jgi:AcrR family transcriptional regulator
MSKKETKKQTVDMRQRIMHAASSLMMDKGIKETSLKDIARKAGISAGTLYYHYSAKEDIIYDIADINLQQITEGLLNWIDHIDAGTSREQILKTVFEKILAAETRGKLHLYLISDAVTANGALKRKFTERYAEWRKTLVLGLNKVLKTYAEANDSLAYLILATIDGLIIQQMFSNEEIPIDSIVKLIVNSS